MASRGVVIPFPMHRVRRPRTAGHHVSLEAYLDLERLEQAGLRFFAWCLLASVACFGLVAAAL
jgi:hypothetical protein